MEIIVNYENGMKFSAQCGKHKMIVDLPPDMKGNDEGPTPPQYFLTSLASCVGVYVAGFCKNSGIDSTGMRITITADKLEHPARLGEMKIGITLPNAEVGKRKEALLSVARKCLIHATIESHPSITVDLLSV